MRTLLLLGFAVLATLSTGYVVLKDKEHIQLNDVNSGKSINASTVNRLAFDPAHNILYVTAKEPRRLSYYLLDSADSATLMVETIFSEQGDGMPLDVEICNPTQGEPKLAISFQNPVSASAEGTVHIYRPITQLNPFPELIQIVTVGAEPVDLEFAQDCMVLLVANRGRPTRESNVYRDPEGTLSKILLAPVLTPDTPITTTTITFASSFSGDVPTEDVLELREMNFRYYPLRAPDNTLQTIMQNIEPERLVISPNGQIAFVSLPKNNAIARVALEFDQVSRIFALGNRSWSDYHMDASDLDGEISLRNYNIYSFFQATDLAWISKGGDEWVVTLDTGKLNYLPAYNYADHQRAKTMVESGEIETADPILKAQLVDDKELGRLYVSREDGKGLSGKIENVFAFGGRGFSIRDANNFETPSVIVDSVERESERFFNTIYNTAYTSNTDTPQSSREATSPTLGPELGAMAVGEFQGKTVLFMGGAQSGILYVYMLSPEARCLQPYFHSIHRNGDSFTSWQTAFNSGHMGDVGITDMIYVETENILPALIVASATSNSISIYNVVDEPFTHA